MENDDWTWLKHEGTAHLWRAPTAVVTDMADAGWYPTDERPIEFNPATAEMPREWFEPAPQPAPVKKTSKRASASTEGTDTDG